MDAMTVPSDHAGCPDSPALDAVSGAGPDAALRAAAAGLPAWTGGRRAAGRLWPGMVLAVALHALALAGAVWFGGPGGTDEALVVVGTIDLAGFGAGGGGAGGDGQEAGAAGALPAGPPASAGATAREPAVEPEPEGPPAAPASEAAPVPDPAVAGPKPDPGRILPPAAPRPRPKPAAAKPPRPRPAKAAAAAAGTAGPMMAAPPAATGAGQGSGTGEGTGAAGDGPGRGIGQGAGPGGAGQGTGGGAGGGVYEGAFGQGDGPRFRHRSPPRYPDEARSEGKEGSVSLLLRIDAEGVLRDVKVVSHCGLEFVEEALRAIRASTFHPAVRQGRSLPCNALLTIRFKLG